MKLSELAVIKEKMKSKVALRGGEKDNRVVVCMGDCGIANGARDILHAFAEGVYNDRALSDTVSVIQTGCGGFCELEPMVEVYTSDGKKTTYVKMTPERVKEVIEKHLKQGNIVEEYTMGGLGL